MIRVCKDYCQAQDTFELRFLKSNILTPSDSSVITTDIRNKNANDATCSTRWLVTFSNLQRPCEHTLSLFFRIARSIFIATHEQLADMTEVGGLY